MVYYHCHTHMDTYVHTTLFQIVLFLLALKQRLADDGAPVASSASATRSAAAAPTVPGTPSASAAIVTKSVKSNLFNSPAPVVNKGTPLSLQPSSDVTPDDTDMAVDSGTPSVPLLYARVDKFTR